MTASAPDAVSSSQASSRARGGAAPELALELVAIEKSFGGVRALRGAELSARPGEILGLCGENGAGKSTLLKILAGVHAAGSYTGTVRVRGEERRFAGTRDAERAGIATVHQELMLVPELSVAENLSLGREPSRLGLVDDEAVELRARTLLERFGVAREIDPSAAIASLGVGFKQVVEIVRALSQDAAILVLDEPTAALTGSESQRLFAWLRDLRDAGTTCLYVSHRMDEIFALCDRVVVLRDGKTVGTVDVATSSADAVVAMMVGRALAGKDRRAVPLAAGEGAKVVLEVRDLSMPLPGAEESRAFAVKQASFTVREGEVVALCGAMGSGRTALLSALFGDARRGFTGSVRIDGREVALVSPRDAIASGVALVPEDRKDSGLVLAMTARENLALPPPRQAPRGILERLGFIDGDEDDRAAARRVADLDVRGDASAEVDTFSGGNQQKIVIGKWLEPAPRVLLLDEPTRGVDVGAREEIYALLDGLGRKGTAIVLASSDLPEVLRLAHRILVLRHGLVVAELDGPTATEQAIVKLTTGADLATRIPAPGDGEGQGRA